MPTKEAKFIDQIEKAYRQIAFAPNVSVEEKMERLRTAYRQAWFDSCEEAEAKWLERGAMRLSAA